MRSPLGYPPFLGPPQSNDRRASGSGLARLIESSRDWHFSEVPILPTKVSYQGQSGSGSDIRH
jgi:hypothetical protein